MARKYQSKPHQIDAFRFTKKDRKFPEWFTEAIEKGNASVTINGEIRYISIYGKEQTEKAYDLDCVCLSGDGKLYVLPNEIFMKYYKPKTFFSLVRFALSNQ